jgi:hypothetical protein
MACEVYAQVGADADAARAAVQDAGEAADERLAGRRRA